MEQLPVTQVIASAYQGQSLNSCPLCRPLLTDFGHAGRCNTWLRTDNGNNYRCVKRAGHQGPCVACFIHGSEAGLHPAAVAKVNKEPVV